MSPCGRSDESCSQMHQHAFGRAEQAHRQIEQMDAGRGHAAGRGLVGLQAPVVPVERQELVVAEVGFDLVDAAQFPGVGLGQQLGDRRLPAPLVPHPENEARVAAEANGLLGAGLGQSQRLFAEDMLAGGDGGLDLRAVQRMRRRQHDGFDRGVGQRIRVVGRQRDALFGAKRARPSRCSARRRAPRGCPPAPRRAR